MISNCCRERVATCNASCNPSLADDVVFKQPYTYEKEDLMKTQISVSHPYIIMDGIIVRFE